ncbi:MAG: ABC transporter substrate-binding protein [Ornithinimicrobium sp.]
MSARSRIIRPPTPTQLATRGMGVGTPLSRRAVIQGLAGAGAIGSLSACGTDADPNRVSLGSRSTEEVPREALQATMDLYEEQSGIVVEINATDPNTYQEQINSYLQGNPDDVFQWFAGYRGRFFYDNGLASDISDVWAEVGDGFSEAFKLASTNDAGQQIFLPLYYYPWAVFYRPSLFEKNGYTVPETMDEFVALCEDMQGSGLNPIAFGASDGWPQMGTFDYLNMRTHGYQFHVELMAGEQRWDSDEVSEVFDTWAGLLPYHQESPLGRTWQEAAQSLQQGESGMYVLGLFLNQQFAEGEDREDLDFFNFPEIDPAIGSDAVEAPIDGFMMRSDPANEENATDLLKFLGTVEAANTYVGIDAQIGAHVDTDTSNYDPLQLKSVDLVTNAANISQFMDRDTRPDFAATVMIPELKRFLANPQDVADVTGSIQAQADSIFPQS